LILLAGIPGALRAQSAAGYVRIAARDEPGEQILLSGVVYEADGVTPAAGARIFAYQTDARGIYAPPSGREPRYVARLRAFFSADEQGHYQIATIRPGVYPQRNTPAHIHVHVGPRGISDSALTDYSYAVPEFLFEGDSLIPQRDLERARTRGRFSQVVRLTRRADGIWEGFRDLRRGERAD
jgi:protocatechuate 3,4-dioxygenase beta subunit